MCRGYYITFFPKTQPLDTKREDFFKNYNCILLTQKSPDPYRSEDIRHSSPALQAAVRGKPPRYRADAGGSIMESATATAAEEEKQDDGDPDPVVVIENVAKAVVHK